VIPPGAGHVTLNFSDCAAAAYVAFLDAPGIAVDDCADEPLTDDFELSTLQQERLFGTADPRGQ